MRALYTAATGMTAQQLRIDNISNNLANVSTTGFKKGRGSFEDLLYQQLPTGAAAAGMQRPADLSIGTGVRMVSMNRDFTEGNLQQTGNTTDLALGSRGFFVLEDPNGTEFYTRDGRFNLSSEGELVSAAGYRLSPGIQIPRDAQTIRIAEDGTVTASFEGEIDEVTLGSVRVSDFVNPAGLRAVGGNLFVPTAASGQPNDMFAEDGLRIQQGFLEASNVDVAEELVNMIVAQRAFELTSKVIQAADETLQTANNIKR
jgi:flagellar basal-body rod protein FlgG